MSCLLWKRVERRRPALPLLVMDGLPYITVLQTVTDGQIDGQRTCRQASKYHSLLIQRDICTL